MSVLLNGIAGNERIRSRLAREILDRTLPHAYIIEGRPGSGRRTTALAAAAALACTRKGSGDIPCRDCPSCRRVLDGLTPDVVRITRERERHSIGVDASRHVRQDIITVPNDFDFKLYIIEDADTMTPQAQNALLLTLEEPPAYAYFFLICESASSLLETVRSRAPTLRTQPIPASDMRAFLVENDSRAEALGKSAPDELEEIILAADGSIGRAKILLDPKARKSLLDGRRLTRDIVKASLPGAPASERIALLTRFPQKREDAVPLLEELTVALGDLTLLKKTEDAPLRFWTDRAAAAELSERFTLGGLLSLTERAMRSAEQLDKNANLRLTLVNQLLASD